MTVFNERCHDRGKKPERAETVLASILDAEVPGWRHKV